ncbi:MAG: 4Fe-4S dicluster domain-containing protein [Planctomycetota bacterium]|jgi:heterodisulfide reductase subunit C
MTTTTSFTEEVQQRSGQDIRTCYQCLKCFVGCPVSSHMDHKPNNVIRMIQYGQREKVLKSHAIWLCVSCMTCGARCPNEIDMSAVMDTLREMSIEEGHAYEAERRVVLLHEEFVRSVKMWGRLHEVTFFLPYIARSLDLFSNAISGILLMMRGKLPLIPGQIEGIDQMRSLYDKAYKTGDRKAGKE